LEGGLSILVGPRRFRQNAVFAFQGEKTVPQNSIEHSPGHRAGAIALKILFVVLTFGIRSPEALAASEPPRIVASYAWAGSAYSGDGTYAVTFDMTLTNPGPDDLNNLTIDLVDSMLLRVLPHGNSLAAGRLSAGESVKLFWTVSAFSDMPPANAGREVLDMAGRAEDAFGNPVGVVVTDGRGEEQ